MDGSNAHSARTADYARVLEQVRKGVTSARELERMANEEPAFARYVAEKHGVLYGAARRG